MPPEVSAEACASNRERERGTKLKQGAGQAASAAPVRGPPALEDEASELAVLEVAFEVAVVRCGVSG